MSIEETLEKVLLFQQVKKVMKTKDAIYYTAIEPYLKDKVHLKVTSNALIYQRLDLGNGIPVNNETLGSDEVDEYHYIGKMEELFGNMNLFFKLYESV